MFEAAARPGLAVCHSCHDDAHHAHAPPARQKHEGGPREVWRATRDELCRGRPRAPSVGPATSPGVCASAIAIDARVANPLRIGPGADAMTSTPNGFSSNPKGFRERLHVGLRGGVVRCSWDALKRHERAHEHDAAPLASDEPPTERMTERGHGATVDVDHPQFFIEPSVDEPTRCPKAG